MVASSNAKKLNGSVHLGRPTQDEQLFSLPGAGSQAEAFTNSDPWRVLRMTAEIVEGFDALSKIGPGVSLFGSARTKPGSTYYEAARTTARLLAENGLTVITGGGPGIMAAGNQGAVEGGGLCWGRRL